MSSDDARRRAPDHRLLHEGYRSRVAGDPERTRPAYYGFAQEDLARLHVKGWRLRDGRSIGPTRAQSPREMSEKYDRYTQLRDVRGDGRRPTLDDCPDCGRPLTRVMDVGGGPDEPGGGRFLCCLVCQVLYVRAQGGRNQVASQHARVLAREVLRLKLRLASLLAPEVDDTSDGPPELVTRIRTDPEDGRERAS